MMKDSDKPSDPSGDDKAADDGSRSTQGKSVEGGNLAHTRAGQMWVAVTVGAVITAILLIFIVQNTADTAISFLGWTFTLPLGVVLLFAALGGLLVMAIAGGARILQLRHALRRQ
ncbi:LapA family protein [Rhodococcus globerulus]|uniref:LapA family protein n=1 Tax=Rhodococcus globerulus TaxID=33008 RepID=UPI003018E165